MTFEFQICGRPQLEATEERVDRLYREELSENLQRRRNLRAGQGGVHQLPPVGEPEDRVGIRDIPGGDQMDHSQPFREETICFRNTETCATTLDLTW